MAVRYKFVHFNTRSGFDSYIPNPGSNSANGNEYYNYVVFIKDTKEIYTHGQFYDCSQYDDSEIKTLIKDLEENKANQSDLDNLIAEINENEFVIAKTLTELEESKADKAVTLDGYGIENAYTKTEMDASLNNYLLLSGGTLNGNLKFSSGYGVLFSRNDYNYIQIPSGDYSALAICKGGMSESNSLYVMNESSLFPYNNNNNDLGTSTKTWKNVYASKFITTGGTASQVVLGDGTLKNLSEISSNVDSITTNNLILNGTSYTKLASGLIYSTLPRDTNTVPAGYYFWNQDTSQVISNYSGFNENTPDTIIIGEKITFNGDNIIKMDGLDDLNGGTIIYCLSYTPKGNIAINGAVYN